MAQQDFGTLPRHLAPCDQGIGLLEVGKSELGVQAPLFLRTLGDGGAARNQSISSGSPQPNSPRLPLGNRYARSREGFPQIAWSHCLPLMFLDHFYQLQQLQVVSPFGLRNVTTAQLSDQLEELSGKRRDLGLV